MISQLVAFGETRLLCLHVVVMKNKFVSLQNMKCNLFKDVFLRVVKNFTNFVVRCSNASFKKCFKFFKKVFAGKSWFFWISVFSRTNGTFMISRKGWKQSTNCWFNSIRICNFVWCFFVQSVWINCSQFFLSKYPPLLSLVWAFRDQWIYLKDSHFQVTFPEFEK